MSVNDQLRCYSVESEDNQWEEQVKGYSSLSYLYDIFNPDQTTLDADKYEETEEELKLSREDYRILLTETMNNMFSLESIAARMALLRFLLRFDDKYMESDCIFDFDNYPLNEFVLEAVFGDKTEIILNYHLINAFNSFCTNQGFPIKIPKKQVGKNIVTAIEQCIFLENRDMFFYTLSTHNDYDFLYTESYDAFVEDVCFILDNYDKK